MVIIVASEAKGAEQALDLKAFPAFARFSRFGLVAGVDAIGCLLEQAAHQFVGALQDDRAHQHLQLRHGPALDLARLESTDQPLDFFVLGEEDRGGDFFFLEPATL